MNEPLTYIGHCLTDIALALDDIARDQRAILDELRQREDVEARLSHVERLLHAALLGELGEGDDNESSPF